jgi:predicted MFS family arabinose efflux permease
MRMRAVPASRRPFVDLPAFKYTPYTLFTAGCFLAFTGMYAPYFYVQLYSLARSAVDEDFAFYLLPILNSTSIVGRIVPNYIADKTGSLNIIVPCAVVTGILQLCLIPISSKGAIIAFCLLYGLFTGSFVSLPPSVLIALSPNRALIGTHMGMALGLVGCGLLVGTPVAGAILDGRGFTAVWIYGGVLTLSGGVFMWAARVAKVGPKLMVRA